MKKYILMFLIAIVMMCSLSACKNAKSNQSSNDQLKIVTTIFPEYDWVREILGNNTENADLIMLLDNGVDLHSYQPTAEDILKISSCDLFIYVGGESDEWVEDALAEARNKDMKVINLLEALGDNVKEEELVEGMEGEDEEEDQGMEDGEEEGPEYDEHVWLSLKNAQFLVKVIADTIGEIDAENADTYKANATAYNKKLAELDIKYQQAVDSAQKKTILFGDRYPFRYLSDDYGLEYYAAFVGCSAETEASFDTIIFLANKVDELGLNIILTIESSDGKIAKTIAENTKGKNKEVLVLDSMQSTTSKDVEEGTTYLSIMENNLNILEKALQ